MTARARHLHGRDVPHPERKRARVVRPNGRIGFVHYIVPNAPPGCVFVRAFGLSMGFGYPMRAVTIFERSQSSLFTDEPAPVSARAARRRKAGAS